MCVVRNLCGPLLKCLEVAVRYSEVGIAKDYGLTYIAQDVHHLLLLEELQDPDAQAVEMRRQGAQIDGARVRLESVHHPFRQRGWQVKGDETGGAESGTFDMSSIRF